MNVFLRIIVLAVSLCCVISAKESNPNQELIFLNGGGCAGKNNHFEFITTARSMCFDKHGQLYHSENYFYSDAKDLENQIDINEIVNKELLKLGHNPVFYFKKDGGKPWECDYVLIYHMSITKAGIDDRGNVLFVFSSESLKGKYRLGVWHKDFGFKIIDIPELVDVYKETFAIDNYLFICGCNKDGQHKMAVIPISEGYWGEKSCLKLE